MSPDQLTVANVVVSWVEAAGIAAAGLLVATLIAAAGLASVFAVSAGLGLAAALLVVRLRVPPLASSRERAPAVLVGLGESVRLATRQPRLRLMLALLTNEAVVVGALEHMVSGSTRTFRAPPARPGVSTDPAPRWETAGSNRERRAKRRAIRPAPAGPQTDLRGRRAAKKDSR